MAAGFQDIRADLTRDRIRSRIRTVATSQLNSPQSESKGQIEMPIEMPLTEWPIYEPTKIHDDDYYINELKPHFNNVNNIRFLGKYQLTKTKHWIIIKNGSGIIFRSSNNVTNQRNLYLELYSFNYDIEKWLESRNPGEVVGELNFSRIKN